MSKGLRIIFLGPPGAGKGTQAADVRDKLNIPHISTGDIFRRHISGGTQLGLLAKSYMDKGELVPDEVTLQLVEDRLGQPDCEAGFLLDGFPRTLPQAQAFDARITVDAVFNLQVPEPVLIQRLSGRRVCKACGTPSHVKWMQSETDVCKHCGGELIQRADDQMDAVLNRLKVYQAQTAPLIGYYEKTGKLININSDQAVDCVTQDILAALKGRR